MSELSSAVPLPIAEGINVEVIVGEDTGAAAVTVGRLTAAIEAELPAHRHKVEEVIYVIAGRVALLRGGESIALATGDGALTPAGVVHALKNVGEAPAVVIFIFPAIRVARDWVASDGW